MPHRAAHAWLSLLALAALAGANPAGAQLEPRPTLPRSAITSAGTGDPSPAAVEANPVIASVDGYPIHLQELRVAMQTLPERLRTMPFETLYPVLVDRLVDHQALVIMAKRAGLEDSPAIKQEIRRATERILEAAYLDREAAPKVTAQAVQAAYRRQYANRPAAEEVRARHILVTTEAEARRIIEELRQGADFATIARTVSKDPDGQNGGDLGFFRREQVWPAFGDLAFSLLPGQIAADPIRNEYGWHVVKVDEKRFVAAPGFSDIEPALRQELLAQAVQDAVDKARGQVIIRRFNLDGSDLETGPRFRSAIAPDAQPQEPPPPAVPRR
jgi:peptidyl-prolyl cis-trans isomerase C